MEPLPQYSDIINGYFLKGKGCNNKILGQILKDKESWSEAESFDENQPLNFFWKLIEMQ